MLNVRADSREMMIMFIGFRVIHVVCEFVCCLEFWGNLPFWLNLGKKVITNLWELWKKKDFKFVMGAMRRARFLESNLSLFPTPFVNDFGGKDMGAWSLC